MEDITWRTNPTHLATNQPIFEKVLSDYSSSEKRIKNQSLVCLAQTTKILFYKFMVCL